VRARVANQGRRPSLLVGLVAAALVACAAAACGTPLQVYPIVGRQYDTEEDCLGAEGTLDVLEGTPPGDSCLEPRCLVTTDTNELFVSAVCIELAGFDDVTDDEPRRPDCDAALLAWEEERYCE
jgi:hypothetical protein